MEPIGDRRDTGGVAKRWKSFVVLAQDLGFKALPRPNLLMMRRYLPLLMLNAMKQSITEIGFENKHKYKYEMQPSRQAKFNSNPLSSLRFEGTILAQSCFGMVATIPYRFLQRWYSTRRRPVVAVGMSGGVDSSVAALLLKRQGCDVFGLYMRNWDSRDEAGGGHCTADQDYEDAQRVCKHLGIDLHHVDYQKEYWTQVFEVFTQKFAMGLTPNPDLACNQYIKFNALLDYALQIGADKLATGHYAQIQQDLSGGPVQLLRGIDETKDQSYFLATVGAAALEKVLFPLGTLSKVYVRELAISEGLTTATKRSSAGICFVGRRDFREFISEYVEMKSGPFVSVENINSHLGTHMGIAAYTHGQRAGISGVPKAFYVVGKDIFKNIVFIAPGSDHPALFTTSAVADDPFWISGAPPQVLKNGQPLKCTFKARYRQSPEECTVCFSDSTDDRAISQGMGTVGLDSAEFKSSTFCCLGGSLGDSQQKQKIQVRFSQPARAITPGQALVLYDGDVCLGASVIVYPGPSLFEQDHKNVSEANLG